MIHYCIILYNIQHQNDRFHVIILQLEVSMSAHCCFEKQDPPDSGSTYVSPSKNIPPKVRRVFVVTTLSWIS